MNVTAPAPSPTRQAVAPQHHPRIGLAATTWVIAYVLLAIFPLLVLLSGAMPKGGGVGWDFAMALGFGGLAVMGLQSALTARFRRATAPFGVDIIYYFHRLAALAGLALIGAHYVILRAGYGSALGPVNPLVAPWHMTVGRLALLLFAVLVASSWWRKSLRIEYDAWRVMHAVLAVAAVGLAIAHIEGVGHYTRAAWKGAVWGGYSAVWLLLVAYVRLWRPWSLWRTPYRVVSVRKERGRSWTVGVQPDGHGGLRFRAGQFAWLTLRANPFQAKEHPFSFSGSAATPGTLQFTIKELGDFTSTVKDIAIGERAFVDGPHGVFTPERFPDAPGFVFIAGGVGIAPIMSMLRTFADRRETRSLRLVYGNRRWEDVLFREEIDALGRVLALDVHHVLQEPPREWPGSRGMLTEEVIRAAVPVEARGHVFFLCGPKPMTQSVQATLRRLGVPLRRMHCELFDMA